MASTSIPIYPTRHGVAISEQRLLAAAVALLVLLRVGTAIWLPLSFDESYFWLWSKHLSVSYFDHPPLIALAIWLGTHIFGDTELGVRAVPLFLSVAGSAALWRAGAILLKDNLAGARACLLFNLTLMAASQFMGATPDALVMAASCFLLLSLAELQQTGDGRWWVAVAGSLGFALLSKYTAFFLVAATALWIVGTREGRAWLKSPWVYAAGALAAVSLVPVIVWNAAHNWISFEFQFARVTNGTPSIRYPLEFIGAQLALDSPVFLIAAATGLYRATRAWRSAANPLSVAGAIVWPAACYFAIHSIHDRVQGNWPSFIYPALALLAAWVLWPVEPGQAEIRRQISLRRTGIALAALILGASYIQTWTGVVPLGIQDPVGRMMAVDIGPAADEIGGIAAQEKAAAIVTTKYVVSGWLSFYLHPPMQIVQLNEEHRWLETPRASLALLRQPLVYVTQHPEHEIQVIRAHFAQVVLKATIARVRNGVPIDDFYVYALSGFHGSPTGRMVNSPPGRAP